MDEAARMDGAKEFTVFWRRTRTGKGPNYPGQRSMSLAVLMYFEAFQKGSWAFDSALAVVIGAVVITVTWAQALLQHRVDKMTR